MESLYRLINIELGKKEMICLVGAGGKTSVMFRLARELSSMGKKVLVTTTTAIFYPERNQYDEILVSEKESMDLFDNKSKCGITVLGRSFSTTGKLLGVNPLFLDKVFCAGLFDYILVEGDGSKSRSLKIPAEHEPVIPSCTTKVLGLIGLDSIGKTVCSENVHRSDLFCSILGCNEGDIIDTEIISKLIVNEAGLFKATPSLAKRYLVLNKADGKKEIERAYDIVQKLTDKGFKPSEIIISHIREVGK